VETVLRVDVPSRSVDAGGGSGLLDPAVGGEAVQGGAGCLAADAAGEGDAAGVGFDDGLDGGEGEAVEAVQDAAVARAAAARPSSGGGVCVFL
jgi:hypothetical protein